MTTASLVAYLLFAFKVMDRFEYGIELLRYDRIA